MTLYTFTLTTKGKAQDLYDWLKKELYRFSQLINENIKSSGISIIQQQVNDSVDIKLDSNIKNQVILLSNSKEKFTYENVNISGIINQPIKLTLIFTGTINLNLSFKGKEQRGVKTSIDKNFLLTSEQTEKSFYLIPDETFKIISIL